MAVLGQPKKYTLCIEWCIESTAAVRGAAFNKKRWHICLDEVLSAVAPYGCIELDAEASRMLRELTEGKVVQIFSCFQAFAEAGGKMEVKPWDIHSATNMSQLTSAGQPVSRNLHGA